MRTSDTEILSLKLDIKAAQEALDMIARRGEAFTDVRTLLKFAMPQVSDWQVRLEKLERIGETHDKCTSTEVANWLKVSCQTIYNWRDRGLLVYDGRRIDVPGTVSLWKTLKRLV